MNRQHNIKPWWQDENDWLCTVEFVPSDDDPEGRLFAADIVGYLFGYAQLTNTRSLALVGDPDAGAYELLFSFSTPGEKGQFLDLVRSNEHMGCSDLCAVIAEGSWSSQCRPGPPDVEQPAKNSVGH